MLLGMDTQGLKSLDRISTLPDDIIENILTLMPIRDATRTSVLSKKWRYSWRSMPKLVLTEDMVTVRSSCLMLKKSLLANAFFHVLLFHNGPTTLEFYSDKLQMVSEFDQIISYLSRRNGVKEIKLTFKKSFYQLPVSFFSLQGLESIELYNCVLEPPLTFIGYSRLKSTILINVKVSAQMLQWFLCKCPLLERMFLVGYELQDIDFVAAGNKFTFVDLLQCVPSIQTLGISKSYMKYLCAGGMPHKLPTPLARNLKSLCFYVCLMDHNEMSSAICIIRSSPVLEAITIMIYDHKKLPVRPTPTNFLDLEDYSDFKLDHLQSLNISGFTNLPLETEFVKLVMAKSPVLKRVQLELKGCVSVDEEVKMLRDMVRNPFPRASSSAQLIIERP